jgi:hypothetical protein
MARQSDFVPSIPDPANSRRQRQRECRCLSCDRPFASTGSGNRICRKCKQLDSWRSGACDFAVHAAF